MEKGSEYMSHSTIYRICLLVVVILAIIGGIFYYVNYLESQAKVTEGTLVMEDSADGLQEDDTSVSMVAEWHKAVA